MEFKFDRVIKPTYWEYYYFFTMTDYLSRGCKVAIYTDKSGDLSEEIEKGIYDSLKICLVAKFPTYKDISVIGESVFRPFPQNWGIVVSTCMALYKQYRGTGWSRDFQLARALCAKSLGYSKMIATIRMDNIPQLVSAIKSDWRITGTFQDRRDGRSLTAQIEKDLQFVDTSKIKFELEKGDNNGNKK